MEENAQLQARSRFYIDDSEEEEEEEERVMMVMPRRSLNLAMALAAERDLRSAGTTAQMKTLVRLFEETDGRDENSTAKDGIGDGGESLCCVCMERNRGAALIPCGHTYCRVCSRELWLNKRTCPLCNLSIRETLHIF
ncbi:PREDICTED: RING finger protein 141-like [Ipomoea nil]|uniref:RING finger protein 141-like n=1 Tax=Ipomoea nil TaxID=35883 RepID=UPI000901E624|nr:PREDICTED: RING finger protein 141-like [Ipomoea nil]